MVVPVQSPFDAVLVRLIFFIVGLDRPVGDGVVQPVINDLDNATIPLSTNGFTLHLVSFCFSELSPISMTQLFIGGFTLHLAARDG